MNEQPLISLIVLSFRRFAQTTGPCLDSLLPQWQGDDAQLLLVDNGSDDGAAKECAAFAARHTEVQYLPLPRNLGFGEGMNAGAAKARGQWMVLVNSDTLFPAGALSALQRTLREAKPRTGLIGPVTNAAGNGQCLPLPGHDLTEILRIAAAAMRTPTGLLTPTYRSDFFCVAIRREAWDRLGGLSPDFGLGYYEDFDFSLRARAAGFEQFIAEDVFVAHAGSATFSAMGSHQRRLLRRNRALMRERHPQVRFETMREGNARALQHLVLTAEAVGWTEGLRERAAWRLAAMLEDEPRSLLKRWRWRFAQRNLQRVLFQSGIQARFPDLEEANARLARRHTS